MSESLKSEMPTKCVCFQGQLVIIIMGCMFLAVHLFHFSTLRRTWQMGGGCCFSPYHISIVVPASKFLYRSWSRSCQMIPLTMKVNAQSKTRQVEKTLVPPGDWKVAFACRCLYKVIIHLQYIMQFSLPAFLWFAVIFEIQTTQEQKC